jgi:hypothetical protein
VIINIRGPGGAGKSTLVRQIMALGQQVAKQREPGRKQPLGYLYRIPRPGNQDVALAIPGHYESRCGGCDTINNYDKLFDLVATASKQFHVLYEGLLISEDVPRTLGLAHRVVPIPVHIIALDTPLDLCLESINLRRDDVFQDRLAAAQALNTDRACRGLGPKPLPDSRGPVDTKKTTDKWKGLRRSMKKIERLMVADPAAHTNVQLHWTDRAGAFTLIRNLLEI